VRLLVATRSAHKLAEIRDILRPVAGLAVIGPQEAGLAPDPAEDALEPFETFEENAASKARWFHERSGLATVSDDSGLVVDALDGAPGVRSKRFAATDAEGDARDAANNRHLLERMGDRPPAERTARYVCAIALVEGPEDPALFRGEAEGIILAGPRGRGGFGYDPLFLDPALGRTFAEITPAEKNARSHRGRAFRALAEFLAAR
jgi:XTP/dITP diphosphohydrolase